MAGAGVVTLEGTTAEETGMRTEERALGADTEAAFGAGDGSDDAGWATVVELTVKESVHMGWANGETDDGNSERSTGLDDALSRSMSERWACGEKSSRLLSMSMGLEDESGVAELDVERNEERLWMCFKREDIGVAGLVESIGEVTGAGLLIWTREHVGAG